MRKENIEWLKYLLPALIGGLISALLLLGAIYHAA